MRRVAAIAILSFAALITSVTAQQAEREQTVRVLSSNGPRAPLEDVQSQIEAAIGRSLDIEFSTSASLTLRIEAGEPFDVAVLTPALIQRLRDGGLVAVDSMTVFARSGVGVGAAESSAERGVGTLAALRSTLLAAESVAMTVDGQSRRVSEAAFERLGITAQMQPKIRLFGPGEGPYAVARGEAELVLTLVSEILPVAGIELVGAFPAQVQEYVTFAAAIGTTARESAAARAFLEQLSTAAMRDALETHGMEALPR